MRKRPSGRPSFEEACRLYVHRFTADYVPSWSRDICDGQHYAPQFASDREWYDHTLFPGEAEHFGPRDSCITSGQTWPFGHWLKKPYRRGVTPIPAPPRPRVAVAGVCNGSSDGVEVRGLNAAADWAANWIRGIDPDDVGVDFKIEVEILDDE